MQAKDRKLLVALATVLLAIWFIGDILLGAAIGSMALASKREAAQQARADSNRRMMGGNSGYSGGSRNMGALELTSFHETIRVPVRYGAVAGLLALLIFAPIAAWTRKVRQYFAQNPRVLVGAVLVALSVAMFAAAQYLAYIHSTTYTQARPLTGTALEMDRRQRTMVNPPSHLNPNGPRSGRPTSITFGADPVENVAISEVDKSAAGYVDTIRLVAAVVGCLGLIYSLLGAQQRDPKAAATEPDSNPSL